MGPTIKTKRESNPIPKTNSRAAFELAQGERAMKLKLLFIVMDVLTLLAYPIVFMYARVRLFSKPNLSTVVAE